MFDEFTNTKIFEAQREENIQQFDHSLPRRRLDFTEARIS
jgi:hypothetical protein